MAPKKPKKVKRPFLTPKEVAKECGVGVKQVRGWYRRKDNPLPAIKPGEKTVRIPRSAFERWLKTQTLDVTGGRANG